MYDRPYISDVKAEINGLFIPAMYNTPCCDVFGDNNCRAKRFADDDIIIISIVGAHNSLYHLALTIFSGESLTN